METMRAVDLTAAARMLTMRAVDLLVVMLNVDPTVSEVNQMVTGRFGLHLLLPRLVLRSLWMNWIIIMGV